MNHNQRTRLDALELALRAPDHAAHTAWLQRLSTEDFDAYVTVYVALRDRHDQSDERQAKLDSIAARYPERFGKPVVPESHESWMDATCRTYDLDYRRVKRLLAEEAAMYRTDYRLTN